MKMIPKNGSTSPRAPGSLLLLPVLVLFSQSSCGETKRAAILISDELEISEAQHDFGDVPHGATPSHFFYLRNISKKKIVLNKTTTSCSCAEIRLRVLDSARKPIERKVYRPPKRLTLGGSMVTWLESGEFLEIEVQLLTATRSPTARRENARTELLFEELEMGRIQLGFDFNIVPRLLILPSHLVKLGSFTKTQDVHEGIELYPLPGKPAFKILRIEGEGPQMQLTKIEASKKNGHRYAVKIGPLGKTEPGYQRTLLFHTDIDGGYVMPVTLVGSCIPNLSFSPTDVHFGRFDFAEQASRYLDIYYGGKLDDPEIEVSILGVKDSEKQDASSFFRLMNAKESNSKYETTIIYNGGLPGRSFRGKLLIRSKDKDHRETKLEFTGFNRGSTP